MNITITLHCPNCQSTKIKKNGKKACGKQNYLCKNCFRQFIGDHVLTYKGCHSGLVKRILLMLVRGIGIRDISATRSQYPEGFIRIGTFSLCNYSP
jgi:transposase-like protein